MMKLLTLTILFCSAALGQAWHGVDLFSISPDTGEIRFFDLDNSHKVTLHGADVVTADFDLTLFNALPADTRCVEVTATGVFQYASATCSGAG